MTDREYLELAAKAAGIYSYSYENSLAENKWGSGKRWNPLIDDGDALRLAVKLGLPVHSGQVYSGVEGFAPEKNYGDPLAATRRAIVRAAAEIGKGMK